jgi:hypothetical protein
MSRDRRADQETTAAHWRRARPLPASPPDTDAAAERHGRFLAEVTPTLNERAPREVAANGPGFWATFHVADPGEDTALAYCLAEPGLAALENRELAEYVEALMARCRPGLEHPVLIFEEGCAYLYKLDGTPDATRPLMVVVPTPGPW